MRYSGIVAVTVAGLALAGCSRGMPSLLGGGDSAPSAQPQIAVNNELAMPPDLSLAAPGTRAAPAARVASVENEPVDLEGPISPTPAPAPKAANQDVYELYGVSKTNPDGTKKEEGKLREELRQAVLAKKRKQNPRHGTVFNIGELFQD